MEPLSLPNGAKFALERLESRGYEAYVVGGCVRDSLLGLSPHDWDLTTNATPDETAAAFSDCRLIDYGKKHGTVTVLFHGEPLEITTYRLDGVYTDNRHPASVTFSKTLADDLARRDFTVNAMAYHPARGLVDLFGGANDLARRAIRCVGNAETRFEEDGLRILRAVRFASALDFSLEPETGRAVHARVALLDHIARERIREEWNKLLLGKSPAKILSAYPDVAARAIPAFAGAGRVDPAALSAAPNDLIIRLSVLFHVYLSKENRLETADRAMRDLRYDNAAREETLAVLELAGADMDPAEAAVRRLLVSHAPQTLKRALEAKRCLGIPFPEKIPAVLETVLARGDCVALRDLAVNGRDLMNAGIPAGKPVGAVLNRLFEAVVEGDLPNRKDALLRAAADMRRPE